MCMMFFRNALLLLMFVTVLPVSYSADPFSEGTTVVRLSAAQRESLRSFIETTRERLERAVEDAQGKTLREAEALYKEAVIAAVLDSYRLEPRTELLTRYALNQGLEIAYGVPSVDGQGLKRVGVLPQDDRHQGVRVVVYEDSIALALAVLLQDKKAVEAGALIDLPFLPFAYTRLHAGRFWSAAIFSETTAYLMSLRLLEHWLAAVGSSNQLHQARVASEILEVEKLLAQENKKSILKSSIRTAKRVRELRKIIRRLLDGEVRATSDLEYPYELTGLKEKFEASSTIVPYISTAPKVEIIEKSKNHIFERELAATYTADGQYGAAGKASIHFGRLGSDLSEQNNPREEGSVGFRLSLEARGVSNKERTASEYLEVHPKVAILSTVSADECSSDAVDCRRDQRSWHEIGFPLNVGFREYRNKRLGRDESTIYFQPITFQGESWKDAGAGLKRVMRYQVVPIELGSNLRVNGKLDIDGSFQARFGETEFALGLASKSGGLISNSTRAFVGVRASNGPNPEEPRKYFLGLENELRVKFPRLPLYTSWVWHKEGLKIINEDESIPNTWKYDTQHWFNLGTNF